MKIKTTGRWVLWITTVFLSGQAIVQAAVGPFSDPGSSLPRTDSRQDADRTIVMARATWDTGWFQAEVFKQLFEVLGYRVIGPQTRDNPKFWVMTRR